MGRFLTWVNITHGDPWPSGYVSCKSTVTVSRKTYGNKVIIGKYQINNDGFGVDEDHKSVLHFSGPIQALTASDHSKLKWVSFKNGSSPPNNAVIGGQRSDGGKLYVARAVGVCGYYDPTGVYCAYVVQGSRCETPFQVLTADIAGKP